MIICWKCGKDIDPSHGYQIGGTDEYGQKVEGVLQHINCLAPLAVAKPSPNGKGPIKFVCTGP